MKIKRIIDISRKIHDDMTVWPGDEGVMIRRTHTIAEGSTANVSRIKLGLHTGTHTDAPLHFVDNAKDVASVDLSRFIGFVKVFEMKADKCITAADLEKLPIEEGDTVFFKTSGSSVTLEQPFYDDYTYVDLSAAKYLVEKKVKAVGVDYLSVGSHKGGNQAVHTVLLKAETAIIEGLDLSEVSEGTYFYSSLPLKIEKGDGSPARAVLIEFED